MLEDDLGKVKVHQKIEFQDIDVLKAEKLDEHTIQVTFKANKDVIFLKDEFSVRWSNVHDGTGEEIDWYILENSGASKDHDFAYRVDQAIKKGETEENQDLELYLAIRDKFNSNECKDLITNYTASE